ncbi:energy transducer TonB [Desertivirga brevis]|uniref:energy transducer TonB n=1 Tax=Desertivirga brevis TaxID=2810310 RepID=UPI001A961E08|nr:energy transducer TonB [Pedobacter sp. SYSU D00873]
MARTQEKTDDQIEEQTLIQKDRSLLYMGVILGVIILVMGYLTFFVDEPWKLFKGKKEAVKVEALEENSDSSLLDESFSMSDEEVRSSLVKFIEAYYYDEKRGYFDPPSYFANITETFYNYHNLTYSRLKDLYWQRRRDMENLKRIWIVSSLKFERQGDRIVTTHWVKESYFRPSTRDLYSAQVQYEFVIDADGKIVSLRDVDVKNEEVRPLEPDSMDLAPVEAVSPQQRPIVEPQVATNLENKVYNANEVDVQPEFNGGQRELIKYVSSNIKYPASARQANIQGKVVVAFIIEKDGSLSDIKVTKGIGGGCDEEALRLVRNSPKWKPGVLKGSTVRTNASLPITFQTAQ